MAPTRPMAALFRVCRSRNERRPDKQRQFVELNRALVREGWGSEHDAYRQWFTSQFIPEGTAEQSRWFNDLERASATPDMMERFVIELSNIDVADFLPKVKAPTLVTHCKGDVRVPFALGQEIAAGIPGAKFVHSGQPQSHLSRE